MSLNEEFSWPGFSRYGSVISGALGHHPRVDRFPTRRTDQSRASKDSCGSSSRERRGQSTWAAQRKK